MLYLVALICLATVAAAAKPSRGDGFELYAYGASGIGGYPLVNINNTMYFSSRPRHELRSDAHVVNFHIQRHSLCATNTDGESSYVRLPSSPGVVTYADGDDDDRSTIGTGFGLSGRDLYVRQGRGAVKMRFYAEQTADPELFAVGWDMADSGNPVAIRRTAPEGS